MKKHKNLGAPARSLSLLLLLVCFAGGRAAAQDAPEWNGSVVFGKTHVQTGMGIVPPGAGELAVRSSLSAIQSSGAGDGGNLQRILRLADGRAVIYELGIRPLGDDHGFEITVRPFVPTPEKAKEWGVDPARIETEFLKAYAAPLVIGEGDVLALDLLANQRTGAKLVDYYRVSTGAPAASRRDAAKLARPLKLEDIELNVDGYELRRDGEVLYRSDGGCSGRFIYVNIPRLGRFVFSVAPNLEAAGFEPTAYADGQRIVFTHGGDEYEWVSRRSVLSAAGVFRVWVRYDPTFSFPFGDQPPVRDRFGTVGSFDELPRQAGGAQVARAREVKSRRRGAAGGKAFSADHAKWADGEVSYIITAEERRAFGMLKNDEDRKRFIEAFWRSRDLDPSTKENEYKTEYYERVAQANRDFSTASTPGWKTDSGRILITFGAPDEVRPATDNGAAETWYYRRAPLPPLPSPGGKLFLGKELVIEFVRDASTGELRLKKKENK